MGSSPIQIARKNMFTFPKKYCIICLLNNKSDASNNKINHRLYKETPGDCRTFDGRSIKLALEIRPNLINLLINTVDFLGW